MARSRVLLSFFLSFVSSAVAQTLAPPQPQDVVSKDPGAVQLISSMDQACGWNGPLPVNLVATGSIGVEGKTEPVVVEAKSGWLRIARPVSNTVLVVSGNLGTISSEGKTQLLSGSEAASIRPFMFPFYTEMVGIDDPTLSVSPDVPATKLNTSVQVVRLSSAAIQREDGVALRRPAFSFSVAIATDTHQPVAIRFFQMSRETEHAGVDADAYLSDFRAVDGVLVPFRYEQRVGDQTLFIIQFDKVVFNQTIPDSDFYLY